MVPSDVSAAKCIEIAGKESVLLAARIASKLPVACLLLAILSTLISPVEVVISNAAIRDANVDRFRRWTASADRSAIVRPAQMATPDPAKRGWLCIGAVTPGCFTTSTSTPGCFTISTST